MVLTFETEATDIVY